MHRFCVSQLCCCHVSCPYRHCRTCSGLVGGRGSGLIFSTSSTPPTNGLQGGAYRRPPEPGPRAGSSGMVMPGQVVPEDVPVFVNPDGSGTAFVAGQRVITSPNSNRILRLVQ